jgi:lipopolysaccharide export system protein LptA
MKKNILLYLLGAFVTVTLSAEELKISSDSFTSDQNKGISVFSGNVKMLKSSDELNASKVTIYTDKKNKPQKFIAVGNVSFVLSTQEGTHYKGVAQKVIYIPKIKEYRFYKDVHLVQLGDKREILGDEVIFKTIEGKAYAKGMKQEPVIMIFDIVENDANETSSTTKKEKQ